MHSNRSAASQIAEKHNKPPVSCEQVLAQLAELKSKNAWTHIAASFHPLEERLGHLCNNQREHEVRAEIAFALSQLHRFAEAIEVLERCIAQQPDEYLYHAAMAFNYYNALMAEKSRELRLGDIRREYFFKAEQYFQKAEQLYPESVVDFYRHGMLYHHLSTTSDRKAVPLFQKAVANWEALDDGKRRTRHKDHKNYVKSLYHLAKSLIRLHDGSRALAVIKKCIAEDESTHYEDPVHKFYVAGKACMETGEYREAIKYLRVAAHQKSKRPKDYIYETLARCFVYCDEHETARQWIEKIPLKYMKPYQLRVYGWILAKLGYAAEAEKQLSAGLKKDRQGGHKTLYTWGRVYYEQKRYGRAHDLFMKANEKRRKHFASDYPDALYYAALCCEHAGDLQGALTRYRETVAQKPDYRRAWKRIRELESGPEYRSGEQSADNTQCREEEEASYAESTAG